MSSCECESPSAYTDHHRTARKHHSCDECLGDIRPGDKYLETTGIWDGSPSRFRFHHECNDLRHALERHIRENQAREREEQRHLGDTFVMARALTGSNNARVHNDAMRTATRYDGLCDCISLGSLADALAEFTREVHGYDPETGGLLRIRGAA